MVDERRENASQIEKTQMIEEKEERFTFNIPWTEKHKPMDLKDIIGQNSQVKNLR